MSAVCLLLTGALALVIPATTPTPAVADDKPGEFDVINETPDKSMGEVSRTRTIYRATGRTAQLSVAYYDGSVEVTENDFTTGFTTNHRRYVQPDASKPRYLERESLFDAKTGEWTKEFYYRPDGTAMFLDEPSRTDKFATNRTIYDVDGKTVLRRVVLER